MPSVFVPTEIREGETRVAANPDTVTRLIKYGMTVQVQAGAGAGSNLADAAFAAAGATLVADAATGYGAADLIFKLNPPTAAEVQAMRKGATLLSFLNALTDADLVDALNERGVSAIAMELVPRITRAQKMDALSSQANLAGYKAVIMAAEHLPKIFPMLMTAAGTIQPARVVIMGAGVAGLQAIATAKRLGAIVEVSDVRPAVKEQVESLGAKFIEVPSDDSAEDAGGYATEQSDEFLERQRALVREKIVNADIVITTAAIPGRPAPKLVTDDMVSEMRPGSVIVDLAVATGGNCTASAPGQIAVRNGVTIIGLLELAALVPENATDMYARNVLNLVGDMIDKEQGFRFNFADEVVSGAVVCHEGQICNARVREARGLAPLLTPQET